MFARKAKKLAKREEAKRLQEAKAAKQAKAMEIKIISYVGQDLDVGLRSGLIGSDPLLRAELAMGLTLSITKPPVQCLMGIFENFFLKT